MTKEEIHAKAVDNANNRINTEDTRCIVALADYDLGLRQGFQDGVEWMQEKMQESNEGQALLYAVEKTAERTKRKMIEKAEKWIKSQIYTENIFEYDNDEQPIKYICASCCDSVDEFIEKFKQAMEE